MKELDFKLDESPFSNFFSSRFSISSKVDVQNAWDFSKENNLSFFIVSLCCLLKGLNSVAELRRRIINGKAIEFDSLDGIAPIMDKNEEEYVDMRVSPPKNSESLKQWHDKVVNIRDSILKGSKEPFSLDMEKRDTEPIANFSCIPWLDFDTLTTAITQPHQIQPLITWGKVNDNGKMSVALSCNHIFVFGKHIGQFYDNVRKYFNQVDII